MTRGVIGNTSGFGPEESQVRALDESTNAKIAQLVEL